MTVLSHAQFHQLRDQANTLNPDWGNESGFSARLHQGPQGEIVEASNVNMVGGVVPSRSHDAPVGSRRLVQFARTHRETLDRSDMYMGAWHEGNRQPKAQVDLDVSQAFPRTRTGKADARIATIARKEKAYGEVGTQGEYQTHTNPFRGPVQDPGQPKGQAMKEALDKLRSDPKAYSAVVSGSVLSGMFDWINR